MTDLDLLTRDHECTLSPDSGCEVCDRLWIETEQQETIDAQIQDYKEENF